MTLNEIQHCILSIEKTRGLKDENTASVTTGMHSLLYLPVCVTYISCHLVSRAYLHSLQTSLNVRLYVIYINEV